MDDVQPNYGVKTLQKFSLEEICKNWREHVTSGYMRAAEESCRKGDKEFVFNSSIAHAIFLTHLLVDTSKEDIFVYSGNFEEAFYSCDYVIESFEKAVESGRMVSICIQSRDEHKEFPARFNNLRLNKPAKVKVYTSEGTPRNKNHFLVTGDAYRFEEEHREEDFRNGLVKASINFNDPEIAGALRENFSSIKKKELTP
jgi:hypothetical protein